MKATCLCIIPPLKIGFDMQALIGGGATGLGTFARGVLWAMESLTKGAIELPDVRRDLPGRFSDAIRRIPDWPRNIEVVRLYPNRLEKPLASALQRVIWEQQQLPALAMAEGVNALFSPALGVPLKLDIPKIATVHDLIPLHKERTYAISDLYFQRYLPKCYTSLDFATFHTETVRGEFAAKFPKFDKENMIVVPAFAASLSPLLNPPTSGGGWDERESEYALSANPVPFSERRGFVCVASFEERKNLGLALDAYAKLGLDLMEKHPLYFIGKGGEERPVFWSLIEEGGLAKYVKLTGFLNQRELVKFLRTSVALIFPSTDEGFGMPPLEAMSFGTPAIISDAPAVAEVYGGVCPAVERTDADNLASELKRLANYEDYWRKLSDKCLSFSKNFSPQRTAAAILGAVSWCAETRGT